MLNGGRGLRNGRGRIENAARRMRNVLNGGRGLRNGRGLRKLDKPAKLGVLNGGRGLRNGRPPFATLYTYSDECSTVVAV